MNEKFSNLIQHAEVDGVPILYTLGRRVSQFNDVGVVKDSDVVYVRLYIDQDGIHTPAPVPLFVRSMLSAIGAEQDWEDITPDALDDLLKQLNDGGYEVTDWFSAPWEPLKAAELFPELAEHFVGVEEGWDVLMEFNPINNNSLVEGRFWMNDENDTPEFLQHVEEWALPIVKAYNHELGLDEPEDEDAEADREADAFQQQTDREAEERIDELVSELFDGLR